MSIDIQQFSQSLADLVAENYQLRRELGLAELDLDEDRALARALGPKDHEQRVDDAPGLSSDADVIERQKLVVATALAEWKRGIREPPHGTEHGRIGAEYIRGEHGLTWSWQKYEQNGDLAWCGAFAAYCYGRAGLRRLLRRKHLASCSRLSEWSADNERRIEWEDGDIRPGDIVIVGSKNGKASGQHITICERFDADKREVATIEGNAHGWLPDGTWAEGVIRQVRPLPREGLADKTYRVKRVCRALPRDILATLDGT